jgi:hypothetical protein
VVSEVELTPVGRRRPVRRAEDTAKRLVPDHRHGSRLPRDREPAAPSDPIPSITFSTRVEKTV